MAKILDTFKDREMELGPLAGAAAGGPWQHWKLARDADGVAWLGFDKQKSGANTLNAETLGELNSILIEIERDPPKGLVLRSLKRTGFIAGADINQFRDKSAADVTASLTSAHAIVDQLDNLKVPTVAVIHGFCLGGGLEVALACDYRIATDSARLGFPEVMLGLHPGLGGTVRLPRLINPVEAMTAMLTGRNLDARRSRKLGLVDAVTPERHVAAAVKDAVSGKLRTNRASTSVALMNLGPARTLLSKKMRTETAKKAPEKHYPAPYALIDLWEKHGGDRRTMQRQEVESFGRLLATPTSQNLVRVFFLREKLKGNAGGKWPGERVHVIGAGTMGADIAAWCAWNGLTVTLADMKSEPLGAAMIRAARLFQRRAHGKSIAVRDALDRLIPDLKGEGARHADLIIEAVPEVLGLKQKIFAACEAVMKPDAILATNTSSIPLEQLREGLKRPERFLGIHFFNPVPVLQLVEVVHHDKVAQDVVGLANSFLGAIDKLPVSIKSAPGFLVNRALMPYLVEALAMVHEGHKKEIIDHAAEDYGMPMGPIELADEVGLDICLHVADVLREQLPRPMPETPQWLRDMVAKGELGKKTGKGMYVWKDGKPQKANVEEKPGPDFADRLILPMIDVLVTCLREGVVADEESVDGSMIFATGFAPFRGGPMKYAHDRGIPDIVAALEKLAAAHGERFNPDPGWANLK